MNILFITPGGLPVPDVKGGAVQMLITNLINYNYENLNISVICPFDESAYIESKKIEGVKFYYPIIKKIYLIIDKIIYKIVSKILKNSKSFTRIFKSFAYNKAIKKHLLNHDYDYIIFEHNLLLLLTMKNKKINNKYKDKYIIHIHNKIRTTKFIKKEYEQCHMIITISEYMKKYLLNESKLKLDSDKIKVLYNGVDIAKFKPIAKQNIPDEFHKYFSDKKINLLYAGRIDKEKGIENVIEAYKLLDKRVYSLTIVGAPFYSSISKSQYQMYLYDKYKEEIDEIKFTGFIPYQYMPYIYNLADIVILPSLWDEPAGLTMLETAMCHKPLITTRSGGIPEYVEKYSLIVDKNNLTTNIINGINDILKLSFDYSNINRFSSKCMCENFEKIIVSDSRGCENAHDR